MTKRITFVIGGMTRGGAERVISILANQYVADGWQVDVVMLLLNKVEYKLNKNIRLIDMTNKSKSRILGVPQWVISFRKYVKENNPDILVSFVARINIVVLMATLGLKKKIIISERNDPAMDGRSKGIDILTKILYKKATKIVFQTKRVCEYFSKSLQDHSVIIPNPISVKQIVRNVHVNKIVSVGRLAVQKNQKMLIDAFTGVQEKYPDYQLWIYGEGDLREELEAYINSSCLEEKVFLPGNVSDIHAQISDAEMFVLSSNYEGLSNALLEAMMMGLPCISTDCAGSDEYIENGYNGLLVSVGNRDELYNAMLKFIDDRNLREEIALHGKESVQKCDSSSVVKQWQSVIES